MKKDVESFEAAAHRPEVEKEYGILQTKVHRVTGQNSRGTRKSGFSQQTENTGTIKILPVVHTMEVSSTTGYITSS